MRIIVAYDGSPGSDAALEEVVRRPWPAGTDVRVVAVVEPPVAYASTEGMAAYGPVFETLVREVREKARTGAMRAVERLRSAFTVQTSEYPGQEGDRNTYRIGIVVLTPR